jgi:hypothetical protein
VIGYASNDAGAPLPGANVFVNAITDSGAHRPDIQNAGVNLTSTGTFVLARLTPATYNLGFRLIGWRPCLVRLTVRAGTIDTIRIRADTMSVVFDAPNPRSEPSAYCIRQ